MTVSKWMSSRKARDEVDVQLRGKGVAENARDSGVADGVSWHTVSFAHTLAPLPMAAPEPL